MKNKTLPAPNKSFDNDVIVEMLKDNNLDFEVKKTETPNPINPKEPTGFYTAYRSDTGKVFQQGLTKRYEPIQNKDIFDCVAQLSKVTDIKPMDIRSFKDGAEIALQVSLGDAKIAKNDKVENYLSVIFSHNGTRSLSLYMTPYRWTCDNCINSSFRAAQAAKKKGRKSIMTIQHSQNASSKLQEMIKGVSIVHNEFKESTEFYKHLRDTTVSKEVMEEVIRKHFPLDVKKDEEGKEKITSRQKNNYELKIKDIQNRISYADGGLQPVNSAWNLYNATQGHIQHYSGRGEANSEARIQSTLIGANESKAAEVLRTIVEMSIGMGSIPITTMANI